MNERTPLARRVYHLTDQQLTEEQTAVVFAMTSRRPESFDRIADQVRYQDSAAEFHEKWVLDYGHSSVAEHAVLHLAIENISRLACDTLEDNRLASYTEKSSRYQVFPQGYYHVPLELDLDQPSKILYRNTCDLLFETYDKTIENCRDYLVRTVPKNNRESTAGYTGRITRMATDSCRSLLPTATLTNVGLTANARTMEHAISKLFSGTLLEEQHLAQDLLNTGLELTPTLIKYARPNPYLQNTRQNLQELTQQLQVNDPKSHPISKPDAILLEWEPEAERKLAAALLYRHSNQPYHQLLEQTKTMPKDQFHKIIETSLLSLQDHDSPLRELEHISFLFDFTMDYGAYREFKRHRMQTCTSKPASPQAGYAVPDLIIQANCEAQYHQAIKASDQAYNQIAQYHPEIAPYLSTHGHFRRVLARINLRQCFHLLKLRTAPNAHSSIREPMDQALKILKQVHPIIFQYLQTK